MNTVVRNEKKQYEFVSIDTASPCNARCIFCFNDWANIKGALMEPEVFEKTLPLLDMTGSRGRRGVIFMKISKGFPSFQRKTE